MGGGKKKEEKLPEVKATAFDTQGFQGPNGYQAYQNMGYQPTPQTFTQAGRPSWMQGHFAMPEWGMRADDPTQQVTPDMLDPRTAMFAQQDAYNAIPQAQAQQAQQAAFAAQNPYGIQGDINGQWTPNAIQGGLPMGNGMQPAQMPQQGYPAAPQQPGAGSVADALARYSGRSSALAPQAQPGQPMTQIPTQAGKVRGGIPMQIARGMASDMRGMPFGSPNQQQMADQQFSNQMANYLASGSGSGGA